MNHGKSICNELKAVRRRIADENDIPLQQEECHYEGECDGTCPHCDAELKYLENELARRKGKGLFAKVAGLALSLVACSPSHRLEGKPPASPDPTDQLMGEVMVDTIEVKGIVVDSVTKEPVPFAEVIFKRGDRVVETVKTDMEGRYVLHLPRGEYSMSVYSVGYVTTKTDVEVRPAKGISEILLEPQQLPAQLMGIPPVKTLPVEIAPDGPSQQMEMDGVKVKVE